MAYFGSRGRKNSISKEEKLPEIKEEQEEKKEEKPKKKKEKRYEPIPLSEIVKNADIYSEEIKRMEAQKGNRGRRRETKVLIGKGTINLSQLLRDNILTYGIGKGEKRVIPQSKVSDEFKDCLLDFLQSGKLDDSPLNTWERVKLYQLLDKIQYYGDKPPQDFYVKRIEVLIGEGNAGNDNSDLASECFELLDKCHRKKMISGTAYKILLGMANKAFKNKD